MSDAPVASAPIVKVSFLTGVKNSIDGFLNANPIIKNTLDAVIHVAIISGLTFVASALAPASATVITVSGIVTAVGAGVKSYAQHQAETYVQNQIDAVTETPTVTPAGK
jgi:hypothetical protein